MHTYTGRWRLGLARGLFWNLPELHQALVKMAENHHLVGEVARSGNVFTFDFRGELEDCKAFDLQLAKVRGT